MLTCALLCQSVTFACYVRELESGCDADHALLIVAVCVLRSVAC